MIQNTEGPDKYQVKVFIGFVLTDSECLSDSYNYGHIFTQNSAKYSLPLSSPGSFSLALLKHFWCECLYERKQ